MSAPPKSNTPSRHCLEDTIPYAAELFGLKTAAGITICSHCFETKIRPTRFASEFQIVTCAKDTTQCFMNTPRVAKLWQMCQLTNSLETLRDYARHRAKIPQCKKLQGDTDPSSVWYKCLDVDYMLICPACFEDYVVPIGLADKFVQSRVSTSNGNAWICDASLPMVTAAFRAYDEDKIGWETIVEGCKARLQEPPQCTGQELSSQVFVPDDRRAPAGFSICGACFRDHVYFSNTHHSLNWRLVNIGKTKCSFASPPGNKIAWLACVNHGQLDHIWRLWSEVGAGKCGQSNSTLYTLNGGNVNLCRGCYAVMAEYFGNGGYWTRRVRTGTCDLSAGGSENMAIIVPELCKSIDCGEISGLVGVSRLDPCLHQTPNTNTRWYGNNQFDACEACWYQVVRGTMFDNRHHLPRYAASKGEGRICDLWSPRMRQKFQQALNQGNLTGFGQFASQRAQLWIQIKPQMDQCLEAAQTHQFQQQLHNTSGSFYQNLAQMDSTKINYTGQPRTEWKINGHWVGSPWYANAVHENAMAMADMSSMNATMASASQLSAMWAEWE